jgi:transposase
MGPRAVSANRLAATVGVSQETLSRRLRHARRVEGMTAPKKRTPRWTGADKRRVVLAAEGLADEALGALLRQEGLHAAQLAEWHAEWHAAAEAALAETAALLVLKNKVHAIWADEDDTTDPRRGA